MLYNNVIYQIYGIAKKLIILVSLFSVSTCTIQEPSIMHQATGSVIKVNDRISLDEAKNVVDYLYENFRYIQKSYIGNDKKFTSLNEIYLWKHPVNPHPECKYMAGFYYPKTPDKYSNSGDSLCIMIISGQYKMQFFGHWLEPIQN